MTDLQSKMIAAAGLAPKDFEPQPSPTERLAALETTTDDMILLMADLIGGK